MLCVLDDGLPAGWDVFHSVEWAMVTNVRSQVREWALPWYHPAGGLLLLLEVKADAWLGKFSCVRLERGRGRSGLR